MLYFYQKKWRKCLLFTQIVNIDILQSFRYWYLIILISLDIDISYIVPALVPGFINDISSWLLFSVILYVGQIVIRLYISLYAYYIYPFSCIFQLPWWYRTYISTRLFTHFAGYFEGESTDHGHHRISVWFG